MVVSGLDLSEQSVTRMHRYCMDKHPQNNKLEWALKDNPWQKTKKQLAQLSVIKKERLEKLVRTHQAKNFEGFISDFFE